MTLAKAIEAAREALNVGGATLKCYWSETHKRHVYHREIIAALPDKPKSEGEILQVMHDAELKFCMGEIEAGRRPSHGQITIATIRALKDAGCLYVGEK